MRLTLRLLLLLLVFVFAMFGDVTITVYPSLAPNASGSPSFAGWAGNALTSLQSAPPGTSIGNPSSDPTAYYTVSAITSNENVVTGFPSWMGEADPTGAFASELGNRLHFGLVILGNGTQFSLSNLSFDMESTDANDILRYVGGFDGSDNYSPYRVGVLADGTLVTSGSATQLVNAFYYVGVGNAPDVYTTDPGATNQEKIDLALAGGPVVDYLGISYNFPATPYSITTTYTLGNGSGGVLGAGSATVDVSAVPEPTALILFATVLGGIFLLRRRRA